MTKRTLAFLALLCSGCSTTPQDAVPPAAQSARLDEARAHLAAGRLDDALLVTDELLRGDPELRAAQLLAAEGNLAMFAEQRPNAAFCLADAIAGYEAALRLGAEDPAAWLQLAHAYYHDSRFERGRDAALKAAAQFRDAGRDDAEDADGVGKALLVAAANEMQIFIASRQQDLEAPEPEIRPETAQKAEAVLSRLEAAKRLGIGEAFVQAALVYSWLGRTGEELDQLERGIHALPGYLPLHERYRERKAQRGELPQCAAFYRATLRDDGPNAAKLFSLAVTESLIADGKRAAGDAEGARAAYVAAIGDFEKCRASAPPDWRESCSHWLAIEHISLARIDQLAGEIEAAKTALRKAFAATPKVLEYDQDGNPLILDGEGASYALVLSGLGRALGSHGTIDARRAALALREEFLALHPKPAGFGWLYNDAGLEARDLGTTIVAAAADGSAAEKATAEREAMQIWERSYELYSIAVELDPNDARTLNDCALMLVYHLDRDLDHADRLLDRAIEAGLAARKEWTDAVSAEDRQLADEALGDAWQNKARLRRDQGKPLETYREFAEQAIRYYPFQQRDAARWLRAERDDGKAANEASTAPDARAAQLEPVAAAAAGKAAEQDFDGALLELDAAADDLRGFAPFHYLRGLYALEYARQAIAKGGAAMQIDGLFAEARDNLQQSVAADPEPPLPRLALAQANLETGATANSGKIADALLLHLGSRGIADPELLARTHAVRAEAGTKTYIAGKQAGTPPEQELQGTRNSYRALHDAGALTIDQYKNWAALEQWATGPAAAIPVWDKAAAAHAEDAPRRAECLYYKATAQYQSALEPALQAEPDAAAARLDETIATYEAAAALHPAYANNCEICIATCEGLKGFLALDRQRFADAEKHFLAAARRRPDRIEAQISANRSVKVGLDFVVFEYSPKRRNDLPAAIATLQKMVEVIRNDADLYNNLGLFARDHGNRLARNGEQEKAKELFEKSLTAYEKAVALEPDSVRLVNDLAVIKLYNVRRDAEGAKAMLEDSARLGEKQLAESPPTDEQALRDLQEAVGDCYQNLGYYYIEYAGQPETARPHLEKSLGFYPFEKRASTRLLQQLPPVEQK